ncbi:hypothetical protein O181_094648 [Austropuccinia psidii MF-1]|uniref:rRNA-processing protein EFG1 n=1 Tax=Austropuccinia psidii MF-1 TaxID=1389203 RepID=A0A9Q3J2F3_9BASI|nr:hypothetical protein [Austropuccinia psidii MF-1]
MSKTKEKTAKTTSATPSSSTKNPSSISIFEAQGLGVSKLKSQLRQAKRLIIKPNINPDLLQKTKQKILELEAALATCPTKEKERNNAVKYHRIKFFDRKKITRRLNQVLRRVEKAKENDKNPQSIHQLQEDARRLRVDLNYLLHYPKHLKYVSLFPGGEYKPHIASLISLENVPTSKDPDALRNYVRAYIWQHMESGALSITPEVTEERPSKQDEDAGDGTNHSLKNDEDEIEEPDEFFAESHTI